MPIGKLEDNDEVAAVAQRAAEIRKLHEESIPNALENINKAQEIQKTNQDKQKQKCHHQRLT